MRNHLHQHPIRHFILEEPSMHGQLQSIGAIEPSAVAPYPVLPLLYRRVHIKSRSDTSELLHGFRQAVILALKSTIHIHGKQHLNLPTVRDNAL